MATAFNRCENVMVGHAVADHYGAPTHLALRLSESLCELERFDASDVMSRYMYLYHTTECNMGEASRLVYEELKASLKTVPERPTVKNFKFTQAEIRKASSSADKILNGLSAGCNPAQRSFPLAYCPQINDENLFQISFEEARLTHFSELAGQVAGLVNLICRQLFRGDEWNDAVRNAFSAVPNQGGLIREIQQRYQFDQFLNRQAAPSYAPNTLHTALYCVTQATSFENAINLAKEIEPEYCLTLVGILASARWIVPESMLVDSQLVTLKAIHTVAKRFNDKWNEMNAAKQDSSKKKTS